MNTKMALAALANAIFALDKPVVLVLQGGRPFAIPEYYNQAAAVLNAVCRCESTLERLSLTFV